MNIAIYNGFNFHYEMLGYLIDYFNSSKINVDIYSLTTDISIEWKNIYEKIFNINIIFHNIKNINLENYDLIFLVTDDDITFLPNLIINYDPTKIICIDHDAMIRRNPVLTRIGTRFFEKRPGCKWALPCYKLIDKIDKKKIINNIQVACVGEQNTELTGEFLMNLFENFNDITFHIIARKIKNNYNNFPNIITYINCSTDKLMTITKNCTYMFCHENPNKILFRNNAMSGSIPLAFSTGCQLIIPETWQHYYNFNSVIIYTETSKIRLNKDTPLDLIYSELYDLISHRNRVFDEAINLKYPIQPKITSDWFSKLCYLLKFTKPNIFIETNSINNDIIELVKNCFREIHVINSSKQFILDRNIISHNGNSYEILDSFIYKRNEPIIFYLNNKKSLLEELMILSKRSFIDIIVIKLFNDENYNLNNIKKAYVRQCMTYNTEDPTKIILIAQV